jgi:uncharacterized C2H2 Zn-finger protein
MPIERVARKGEQTVQCEKCKAFFKLSGDTETDLYSKKYIVSGVIEGPKIAKDRVEIMIEAFGFNCPECGAFVKVSESSSEFI